MPRAIGVARGGGRGARGYLALYRDVSGIDVVFVLALRAQRESAYRRHGR